MSKIKHAEPFTLTVKHLIRFIVFISLILIGINLVSSSLTSKSDKKHSAANVGSSAPVNLMPYISSVYSKIPPDSRRQIENIGSNSAIISIRNKSNSLITSIAQYPALFINDLKKQIIKNVVSQLSQSLGVEN